MKITLAIPTNRGVKGKTVYSLLDLVAYSGYEFHIVVAEEGYTIAENRNYIASQALKNKSDYLLMVDDDMTFPPDTLERLLKHKKKIIGVLSNSRLLPLKHTIELDGEVPKELFKCKAVGGGVLLIDMNVFKEMPQPWFDFETHPFGMIKRGEDKWFCDKANLIKIEVWCDPSIQVKHIGDYLY